MKIRFLRTSTALLIVSLALMGCQKQDHAYKDYVEGGERIYIGKVDEIVVMPGKSRVGLEWSVSDPRVKSIKIKYNEELDSVILDLNKSLEVDKMETIISDLDERIYTFSIYALDENGNQSVAQRVDGRSYGESYRQTLSNRGVNKITKSGNNITVTWFSGNAQMVETEIVYTDFSSGTEVTLTLAANQSSIVLNNADESKGFAWRTVYKPSPLSLDVFYTDFSLQGL